MDSQNSIFSLDAFKSSLIILFRKKYQVTMNTSDYSYWCNEIEMNLNMCKMEQKKSNNIDKIYTYMWPLISFSYVIFTFE